jgi:hypothetical protein
MAGELKRLTYQEYLETQQVFDSFDTRGFARFGSRGLRRGARGKHPLLAGVHWAQ